METLNFYKLYTDGSYINHLNCAGIGGYLLNAKGLKVFEFSEIIENKNENSKHEILAIERGLLNALTHGVKNILCYSDEKSLCDILNIKDKEKQHQYVLKNNCLNKVLILLDKFDNIKFTYISRKLNKNAHYLSHKTLKEIIPDKNLICENSISIPNFYCTEQFIKKDKINFHKLKEDIVHHYIFQLIQYKNKQILEVKKSTRNNDKYILEHIESYSLPKNNWQSEMIFIIGDTLKNSTHKYCGIMLLGKNAITVDKLIRGVYPSSKNTEIAFNYLIEIAKSFDAIVAYNDFNIINILFPKPSLKVIEEKYKGNLKDFYIDCMIDLSSQDYHLGSNPIIEKHFDFKPQDNLSIIQKKYFGEFLKLTFIEQKKIQSKNLTLEEKHYKLNEAKQDLMKKGIKFC